MSGGITGTETTRYVEGDGERLADNAPTPEETRRDRFLRLAPKRVQKALDALRQVERCGARAYYEYKPEEAEEIARALVEGFNAIGRAFGPPAPKPKPKQFGFTRAAPPTPNGDDVPAEAR